METEIFRNILYHYIGNEFCSVIWRLLKKDKQEITIREITKTLKDAEETIVKKILNDPEVKQLIKK